MELEECRLAIAISINQLHKAESKGWSREAIATIETGLKLHRKREQQLLKTASLEDKPTFLKGEFRNGTYTARLDPIGTAQQGSTWRCKVASRR